MQCLLRWLKHFHVYFDVLLLNRPLFYKTDIAAPKIFVIIPLSVVYHKDGAPYFVCLSIHVKPVECQPNDP